MQENFRRLSLRVQFPDLALLQHLNQNHHHPLGGRNFDSFSAVLWCKIKVNMHLFHLAKGFPILDFKDVQSMDLVQQMEVWEVQNYL